MVKNPTVFLTYPIFPTSASTTEDREVPALHGLTARFQASPPLVLKYPPASLSLSPSLSLSSTLKSSLTMATGTASAALRSEWGGTSTGEGATEGTGRQGAGLVCWAHVLRCTVGGRRDGAAGLFASLFALGMDGECQAVV